MITFTEQLNSSNKNCQLYAHTHSISIDLTTNDKNSSNFDNSFHLFIGYFKVFDFYTVWFVCRTKPVRFSFNDDDDDNDNSKQMKRRLLFRLHIVECIDLNIPFSRLLSNNHTAKHNTTIVRCTTFNVHALSLSPGIISIYYFSLLILLL